MSRCTVGRVVLGVSKDRSTLETLGITRPATHFYVPDDRCDSCREWGGGGFCCVHLTLQNISRPRRSDGISYFEERDGKWHMDFSWLQDVHL